MLPLNGYKARHTGSNQLINRTLKPDVSSYPLQRVGHELHNSGQDSKRLPVYGALDPSFGKEREEQPENPGGVWNWAFWARPTSVI